MYGLCSLRCSSLFLGHYILGQYGAIWRIAVIHTEDELAGIVTDTLGKVKVGVNLLAVEVAEGGTKDGVAVVALELKADVFGRFGVV